MPPTPPDRGVRVGCVQVALSLTASLEIRPKSPLECLVYMFQSPMVLPGVLPGSLSQPFLLLKEVSRRLMLGAGGRGRRRKVGVLLAPGTEETKVWSLPLCFRNCSQVNEAQLGLQRSPRLVSVTSNEPAERDTDRHSPLPKLIPQKVGEMPPSAGSEPSRAVVTQDSVHIQTSRPWASPQCF